MFVLLHPLFQFLLLISKQSVPNQFHVVAARTQLCHPKSGGRNAPHLISPLVMLFLVLGVASVLGQAPAKPAASGEPTKTEDFATAMKKIRDTWVQEFNAGHADKVAALYAQEAVLMRRNGSVHNRDSILAELQRSITAEARNYTVHSLHTEHSGDLGYDTGYTTKIS